MHVFEYLRFNFKTQVFVMKLPIRLNSEMQCGLWNEKVKNLEKHKVRSHNKVR